MVKKKETATEGNEMVVAATIKECKMTAKGAKMQFDNISITLDQFKSIAGMVEDQEPVLLSIRVVQENLPGV